MATDHEEMLVRALKKRQAELGLSDGKMAVKLGVSGGLWSLVKRGKRRMGRQFLEGVVSSFPELTGETLILLRRNVADITGAGKLRNAHQDGPQPASDAPAAS